MKIKPTQEQIDKATLIMEIINESQERYLSQHQLPYNYFDDDTDKQIVAALLARNRQRLTIRINNDNTVEWF
ncbi:hypothetical protein D3P96_02750 [Weissella viridescens]|uniref:Uncharacterized protein n=1 Tax=Weissella viridescens TaxID=1629 RepID=A0A3P2RFG8_WEIVI|nr:hypothetical protein [Weissella viridescens]RRG18225.1 hypothetical protein D3P96_02750 [Weissella viridescens]